MNSCTCLVLIWAFSLPTYYNYLKSLKIYLCANWVIIFVSGGSYTWFLLKHQVILLCIRAEYIWEEKKKSTLKNKINVISGSKGCNFVAWLHFVFYSSNSKCVLGTTEIKELVMSRCLWRQGEWSQILLELILVETYSETCVVLNILMFHNLINEETEESVDYSPRCEN